MSGLHPPHFRDEVIRPALARLPVYMQGKAAERLLMGTALAESRLIYLKQLGGGPALGVFQMEPATHDDIWTNFLRFKESLRNTVNTCLASEEPTSLELTWNLQYAALMARVHYWRVPEGLPDANDIDALGTYWKRHYNTHLGAGDPVKFTALLEDAIDRYGV